jgi:hypothetical protein
MGDEIVDCLRVDEHEERAGRVELNLALVLEE